MTRRIVKPQPEIDGQGNLKQGEWLYGQTLDGKPHFENFAAQKCPYGKIGDTLWVRETWAWIEGQLGSGVYIFNADGNCTKWVDPWDKIKWKPSIFMPKEACRLWLEITDIRVERLMDISEEDATKEGFQEYDTYSYIPGEAVQQIESTVTASMQFLNIWDRIHGQGATYLNPFVWVISFRKIEKP